MHFSTKTSYHPYLLIAFHLNCLPEEWQQRIPRSTRHDWKQKDFSSLFGHDWYLQNRHLFQTLREVAASKKLLRFNRALLQIIALKRFIEKYHGRLKEKRPDTLMVVITRLEKIAGVIRLRTSLKYLERSYSWWLELRKPRCRTSLLERCHPKHPGQLLKKEIVTIERYCKDERFTLWPRAAVYHQIIRDRAAAFTISTFYKYVSILGLQTITPGKRRKNHYLGIRASIPLQIIHADITQLVAIDNSKGYLYLVQDNYSRAILQHSLSTERKAQTTFDNLTAVYENYIRPSGIETCQLITDDGSENYGPVKTLVSNTSNPAIQHLIAQIDISFSNSMIEAANKQLKHGFLYHKSIANFTEMAEYVRQAIDDYNNRPHNALGGLTPLEALNGKKPDKTIITEQMAAAKATRLEENRKRSCCGASF